MNPDSADGLRVAELANGITLITERLPWVRSVCLGLSYRTGSRDDPPDLAGLCHLVEHMVFKGTKALDARQISFTAESLGAELNAFTDKEQTVFYGRFPSDEQTPVAELLCDIVAAPAFDEAELEKEKGIIAEEIQTADEDPDSRMFNLVFEAFYGDHPMAWPVSGTCESVGRARPDTLRAIHAERSNSANVIAVAAGDVRHSELADLLERRLEGWSRLAPIERRAPAPVPAGLKCETRSELTQSYVCLTLPTFPFPDERRTALAVFNTAFGGGLSSRLFQRLRESEGLVYSVSSFADLFEDSGLLGIYFVADARKLGRCVSVIREEVTRLREQRFSRAEFDRALNMTRSSTVFALESTTSRMMRLARSYHLLGRVQPAEEVVARLDRIGPDEVNELVEVVFDAPDFHVGVVGPKTEDELRGLLG